MYQLKIGALFRSELKWPQAQIQNQINKPPFKMKSSAGTNSIETVVYHSVMFQREDDFYYFSLKVVNSLRLVENSQTIIDVSFYRSRDFLRNQ